MTPARVGPPIPKLSLAVCIFCLLAIAALLYAPLRAEFLKIEPWSADWRTAFLSDKTRGPHAKVAIVVINKDTLAGYPYHSPTPRNLLAAVIEAVDAADPAAIGLDIYFVRPTDTDNDQALVRAVRKRHGKVVLAAVNESATQFSESERQFQSRFLSEAGARAGYLNLRRDQDEVVRYTSPPLAGSDYPDSFALQVARTALGPTVEPKALPPSSRIAWLLREDYTPEPFAVVLAHDLLAGAGEKTVAAARAQLKGKAVLIGNDRPYVDRHRTPFSVKSGDDMLGLTIHAHITAQMVDGRSYSELGTTSTRALVGGLALMGFLLGWMFFAQRLDLTGRSMATVALVAIDALVYSQLRIILPFTVALTAWLIGVAGGHHLRAMAAWASERFRWRTARQAAA
jgi:CHASE2 domain-containing sensor protein